MGSQIKEMADLARTFCELIEQAEWVDPSWLTSMTGLLSRLHAVAEGLEVDGGEGYLSDSDDLDARFELFSELRQLLGPKDGYWMTFDVAQDGQAMSGSLADDLTDIYCELKHGLSLLEQAPDLALENWHNGYRYHWGQHLVDASRHLYELSARRQL